MYLYWDPTYILVIVGAIICMIASARVKTTFNKYSRYRSMSGMTGAQAAQRILQAGVAAHECGHAIQHARGYVPLKMRSAFVPIANFGSMLAWPVIIIGALMNNRSSMMIIDIGIILFSYAVIFQLITLPVEFDASRRAMMMLRSQGILGENELNGTRKVLTAAALTYVASAAAAILQLLRIILLFGGRDRD